MGKVTFVEFDGTVRELDIKVGQSLMELAIGNQVNGIDADCGGQCSCATCHVYVDDAWLNKLPAMTEMEDSMLDMNTERQANSRLTCQIPAEESLDGLVVQVPEFQT